MKIKIGFILLILVGLTECLFCFDSEKVSRTIQLLNSNQYDEVISLLKNNGTDNEILLAIAYVEKRDLVNAKNYAQQSLRRDSQNVVANYILAQIYEEERDYNTAINYWEKVLYYAKDKTVKSLAKKHCEVLKMLSK